MIIGETICAVQGQTTTVYSPWFLRQGNAATFTLDVIAVNGATVTVTIQTKNTEEVDPGTAPAPGGTLSKAAVGRDENRNYNFKELLRFKFEVTSSLGANVIAWSHFRMLNPAWETN